MRLQATALLLVALLPVGCGQLSTMATAPATSAIAAQAKTKLDAKTKARAVVLLEEAFPAWTYPARNAFSSVAIPGSHAQPVGQKTAGVGDLELKLDKAGALAFEGVVTTEAQTGTSHFVVEGTIDVRKSKVNTTTIRYIP